MWRRGKAGPRPDGQERESPATCTASVPSPPAPPIARRVFLDVPFEEKDKVKRLGARWDPTARRWFLVGDVEGVDVDVFGRWLPMGCYGPTTPGRVLLLPENCYRCGALTWSIAGVLVDPRRWCDPDGFMEFGLCADVLAALVEPAELTERHIGPLRKRHSSVVDREYLSNGCWSCGTIMGSHYVTEAVAEYLAEGGRYERLHTGLTVDYPVAAVEAALRFLSGFGY